MLQAVIAESYSGLNEGKKGCYGLNNTNLPQAQVETGKQRELLGCSILSFGFLKVLKARPSSK